MLPLQVSSFHGYFLFNHQYELYYFPCTIKDHLFFILCLYFLINSFFPLFYFITASCPLLFFLASYFAIFSISLYVFLWHSFLYSEVFFFSFFKVLTFFFVFRIVWRYGGSSFSALSFSWRSPQSFCLLSRRGRTAGSLYGNLAFLVRLRQHSPGTIFPFLDGCA